MGKRYLTDYAKSVLLTLLIFALLAAMIMYIGTEVDLWPRH